MERGIGGKHPVNLKPLLSIFAVMSRQRLLILKQECEDLTECSEAIPVYVSKSIVNISLFVNFGPAIGLGSRFGILEIEVSQHPERKPSGVLGTDRDVRSKEPTNGLYLGTSQSIVVNVPDEGALSLLVKDHATASSFHNLPMPRWFSHKGLRHQGDEASSRGRPTIVDDPEGSG